MIHILIIFRKVLFIYTCVLAILYSTNDDLFLNVNFKSEPQWLNLQKYFVRIMF